ncbi:hypothetical protein Mpal_0496 [Methanosphaerula palustris E1-9c]|uniref:Uncharacterized protein n=1 Tax=Methanosphaerula palustris (strain ATCC BAA-1556 / DSM 19958 / E1-9c) TaxID=521011 RepID=B8GKI6_METPE|nr:hypothetical protein Mpal_0496 [Methanosphaerula palustris E1-9c]
MEHSMFLMVIGIQIVLVIVVMLISSRGLDGGAGKKGDLQ